jgi:hypothetical protein
MAPARAKLSCFPRDEFLATDERGTDTHLGRGEQLSHGRWLSARPVTQCKEPCASCKGPSDTSPTVGDDDEVGGAHDSCYRRFECMLDGGIVTATEKRNGATLQPSEEGGPSAERRADGTATGSRASSPSSREASRPRRSYYIHLEEDVPEEVLSGLFGELRRLQPERDGAVLVGAARDPEELTGIMARLSLLGFTVLEVRRVDAAERPTQCRPFGPTDGPGW